VSTPPVFFGTTLVPKPCGFCVLLPPQKAELFIGIVCSILSVLVFRGCVRTIERVGSAKDPKYSVPIKGTAEEIRNKTRTRELTAQRNNPNDRWLAYILLRV
jgi:hypothetical protein